VTGGAAWGGIKVGDVYAGNLGVSIGSFENRTLSGWTVGGGLEWVLLGPLTAKFEYLYVDLGSKLFFNGSTDPFLPRNVNFREHIARIGANYRFTP